MYVSCRPAALNRRLDGLSQKLLLRAAGIQLNVRVRFLALVYLSMVQGKWFGFFYLKNYLQFKFEML
jgi:hypothetical protein